MLTIRNTEPENKACEIAILSLKIGITFICAAVDEKKM